MAKKQSNGKGKGWHKEIPRHQRVALEAWAKKTAKNSTKLSPINPLSISGNRPSEQKDEVIGDVWELESNKQKEASNQLEFISDNALNGDRKSQNILKKIFDESWSSIKEKLNTEGSVYYVWWMDGVNALNRSQDKIGLIKKLRKG